MNKIALLNAIKRHNQLYRAGRPEISDGQYDEMVEQLRQLDPENEWFQQTEPAPVNIGRKRKLPMPMKSLNKVKSLHELQQWLKSLAIPSTANIVITPKYDGVSWLHNEMTDTTYSRGGAENEGQDCTEHYRKLNEIYIYSVKPFLYTFGELVFSRQKWEEHFAGRKSSSTGDVYKSPRNTVAGFINRDEAPDEIKYADFVRYGVDDGGLDQFDSFHEVMAKLSKLYYQPELHTVVKVKELSEEMLADLFARWRSIYYIDGLVIYIDDLRLWEVIGRQQTSGNPLYAIAYKHPDFTEAFETTVKGITWKANKSGALKPVVNIEAVDTGDCCMENPTGYNANWLHERNIARGAKILVTRSGGVIPKILQTLEPAPTSELAELWESLHCPHCNSRIEWSENGIEALCANPDCPGKNLAKIIFFFLTVGAENVGEETFTKLYDAGFTNIKAILNITFDELMKIEGFGNGIANIILENNRKIIEGVDLATLMHASDCFKGIGRIKAQGILDSITATHLDYFLRGKREYIYSDDEYSILSKTYQSFADGIVPFHDFLMETNIPFKMLSQTIEVDGKYRGMAVCFSGVRDKSLEDAITSQGGKIASGVSKTTTHLVVKDPSGTSSKITKAQQLGIPIMTIEQFNSL